MDSLVAGDISIFFFSCWNTENVKNVCTWQLLLMAQFLMTIFNNLNTYPEILWKKVMRVFINMKGWRNIYDSYSYNFSNYFSIKISPFNCAFVKLHIVKCKLLIPLGLLLLVSGLHPEDKTIWHYERDVMFKLVPYVLVLWWNLVLKEYMAMFLHLCLQSDVYTFLKNWIWGTWRFPQESFPNLFTSPKLNIRDVIMFKLVPWSSFMMKSCTEFEVIISELIPTWHFSHLQTSRKLIKNSKHELSNVVKAMI